MKSGQDGGVSFFPVQFRFVTVIMRECIHLKITGNLNGKPRAANC